MTTPFKGISVAGGGANIPAGRYRGFVRDVAQMIAKASGNPFLVWYCVVELDGELVNVDGSSSLNTGPQSKPRKWMTAILGREIARGEYIAKEHLLDRPCVIDVAIAANGWAFVADIKPIPASSPAIPLSSPAGPTPSNGFTEDLAAKAAAAQADAFGEMRTAPPAIDDELPF